MLPAGTYKARAVDAALGMTGKGTEQIAVEFEILEEPSLAGQRITWYGYFSEKAFDRTIESLRYCGWEGNDLANLTGISTHEVQIVVEHDEYDGKVSAKVQWVNRLGGLAMKERMDDAAVRKFAAQMKGRIAALGGGKSAHKKPMLKGQGASPEEDADPGISDDNVPF